MSILEAIVLGIVQGLTEFLPISSTAHLRVVPAFAGWPDPGAAFTAVTQLGTMLAVVIYFRADLLSIARTWSRSLREPALRSELDARLGWYLIVATIPISIFGLAFKDQIETSARDLYLIGTALIVLGLILLAAERFGTRTRDFAEVRLRDATVVGLAQALALIPGVSRSGATFSMALFLGHPREQAARFSFLLATPITAAAALYKVPHLLQAPDTTGVFAGMLAAAVVGFLSIRVLLAYVRTRDYRPFVIYRFAFALLVAGVWYLRRSHLG